MNINTSFRTFLKFIAIGFFCIIGNSCENNTQVVEKTQQVIVYTDHIGENDSLLFSNFEKQQKIKVHLKKFETDSLLSKIHSEAYNSYADLIIIHGIQHLEKAQELKLFRPIPRNLIAPSYPENYIAENYLWIGLSKSPLVIAYSKNVLKKDTLRDFNDLLSAKWEGKITLQEEKSVTLQTLIRSMKSMHYTEAANYLQKLKMKATSTNGTDEDQLRKINAGKSQLGIVELASILRIRNTQKDSLGISKYQQLEAIFPNQAKKGSFYSITGAGIFRYARNTKNAESLLLYLTQQGQQNFAKGRHEFPVKPNVEIHPALIPYEKFRARFNY